jgi:maltose alpha-D-glucosyltransferase / alpha-amylase
MPKRAVSTGDPLWYTDAIVYELHIRAFEDSNGDGIGDFPGLIQRLDHIQDLGVACLWLLPFFPSPLKDDGYDISDYMNVHSMYGTIDDFRAFLAAAHERDLQFPLARASTEGEAYWR